MPIKTGVQAIQEIRAFFASLRENNPTLDLKDPEYIVLTAFKTPHFDAYLKSQGISQCYDKPIEIEHFA